MEGAVVNQQLGRSDARGKQRLASVVRSNRRADSIYKLMKKLLLVLMERCQNTQCITLCCVWSCIAAEQSGCPVLTQCVEPVIAFNLLPDSNRGHRDQFTK